MTPKKYVYTGDALSQLIVKDLKKQGVDLAPELDTYVLWHVDQSDLTNNRLEITITKHGEPLYRDKKNKKL